MGLFLRLFAWPAVQSIIKYILVVHTYISLDDLFDIILQLQLLPGVAGDSSCYTLQDRPEETDPSTQVILLDKYQPHSNHTTRRLHYQTSCTGGYNHNLTTLRGAAPWIFTSYVNYLTVSFLAGADTNVSQGPALFQASVNVTKGKTCMIFCYFLCLISVRQICCKGVVMGVACVWWFHFWVKKTQMIIMCETTSEWWIFIDFIYIRRSWLFSLLQIQIIMQPYIVKQYISLALLNPYIMTVI